MGHDKDKRFMPPAEADQAARAMVEAASGKETPEHPAAPAARAMTEAACAKETPEHPAKPAARAMIEAATRGDVNQGRLLPHDGKPRTPGH